ncbi:MAG TPA: glycosyltransferase [Solirubrobacteraceae bacterium]|jgi:glycosyltransferase involved in cell wall biosynthesis
MQSSSDDIDNPLISLAVPIYKPTDKYLRDLVESVRDQDYRPLELVMCDDASGADLDWLPELKTSGITIKRAVNERRAGMVGNWNAAVSHSTGEFVILLHQDDLLATSSVRRLSDALRSDSSVVAVGSAPIFIDAEGNVLERKLRVNHRSKIFLRENFYRLDRKQLIYLSLRNGQALGEPSAVMFRKDAFLQVGGYDAKYEHAADVDFTLRLASIGDAVYVNQALFLRRWHQSNLTHHNRVSGLVARDRRVLYRRYADMLESRERGRVRAAMVSYAFFDGRMAARFGDVRGVLGAFGPPDIWRVRPRTLIERAREVTSGHNLDRR